MDLGIAGKVALVTAASKGLGKAVAEALAREGVDVVIASRKEDELRQAARDIEQRTGRAPLTVAADVSRKEDIDRLVGQVLDRHGRIDVLFTNSGGPPPGMFFDFTDEQWHQAVDLLLMSTVRLIRAAAPGMQERKWGRIITSTSVAVKQPIAGLTLSNAVRTAIVGLAKTLSQELAPDGITVNNLLPGSIFTDRIKQLNAATAQRTGKSVDEARREGEAAIPLGRYGTPEEYGAAAAFLASQQAAYITGVSLLVDGGVYRGTL
ncbi:MAG TPA: SDR family oxidoreductase [Thermomicrobiales bacterium]|nr:SDR family oxidoreductase [Thermomicrobiales bacterium]